MKRPKKPIVVLLVVVDGWGIAPPSSQNAISLAKTPFFDDISSTYKTFILDAAGENIGLSPDMCGNSELGHLHLSSGRVIHERGNGAVKNCIPEVISRAGKRQYYISETKKYGHLAFYFNGRNSKAFKNVDYALVQASHVIDYSKNPRMKTPDVAQQLSSVISRGQHEFYMTNFPNIDKVAHSGNIDATIEACERVDDSLKRLVEVVLSVGGDVIVTSDHGNGEQMIETKHDQVENQHTTNPVPCIIIGEKYKQIEIGSKLHERKIDGPITRVAPTVLDILHIDPPHEMDQVSLLR